MMDWADGTEERRDYNAVTRGSKDDAWFQANKERIRTAAMGKGAPQDYELALEWAVRSKKIPTVTQATLQTLLDDHLGIDCSGFVTNYLVACGKKTYSSNTVRNTSAASYYNAAAAINDATRVRAGDLLVWMDGNSVKTNPGHVAVVESYVAQSAVGREHARRRGDRRVRRQPEAARLDVHRRADHPQGRRCPGHDPRRQTAWRVGKSRGRHAGLAPSLCDHRLQLSYSAATFTDVPLRVLAAGATRLLHPGPRWHGGSSTRNLNKIGVRFWTAPSF